MYFELSDDEDEVIVLDDVPEINKSGRPKRKAAANVSAISKKLANPKPKKPLQVLQPRPAANVTQSFPTELSITDVRGSVPNWQTLPLHLPNMQSMLNPTTPPSSPLILAHQVGTNQRVLIPREQFDKLLPGQFTFIKNVNTKVCL